MRDSRVVITGLAMAALALALKPLSMRYVGACVRRDNLNARPLHDAMHHALPDLSRLHWVSDVQGVAVSVVGAIMLVAVPSQRSLWLRALWVFAAVTLLKVFVNATTIVPDPSGECEKRERGNLRHVLGSCNDLMPSGHVVVSFALLYLSYGRVPEAAWLLLCAHTAVLVFFTIASRNHYTLDVVVSALAVAALGQVVGPTPS